MLLNSLSGVLTEKGSGYACCLVNGVEWALAMGEQSLSQLPAVGAEVRIYTRLKISENNISLYGFASLEERSLFDGLISVSGVGPKLALGLLSKASAGELALWIAQKDVESLAGLPGLGKKTAQKLVLQLSERIEKQLGAFGALAHAKGADGAPNNTNSDRRQKYRDLRRALEGMGHSEREACEALDKLFAKWDQNLEGVPDEGECILQAIVLLHRGA